MIIKLDMREHELIRACKVCLETTQSYSEISIITEALPIGDIIITSDNVVDSLIIERKSLRDLSASIKDGRYEEQSYRLNGINHPNHNIIYLIEGDMNKPNPFKDRMVDKMTLYSAMVSLNFYKGFSVMRSSSVEESALMICNMANKIRKSELENKKPYYTVTDTHVVSSIENTDSVNDDVIDESKQYCSVVKKVKKENITKENIGEIMISQIPGISNITAYALMNHFKTLPNLIVQLSHNSACLDNITYVNSKGQTRKISKTVLANVRTYLQST